MKNKQTNLMMIALIMTGFAISCGMFSGSNSNVANNSTPGNANANTAAAAKNEDLPLLAAPKLVEMLMADTTGLNARLKDQEIIVIGELGDTMNGIQLNGGPLRTIYCTMASNSSGSDDKFQKLNNRPYGSKKPIVEVRGVYTNGTFETREGLRYVSIYLDKCTILSVKE